MFKRTQSEQPKSQGNVSQTQNPSSQAQKQGMAQSQGPQATTNSMQFNIVQQQIKKIQELEKQLEQEKQEREQHESQHIAQIDQLRNERDEYHSQLINKQGQFEVLQAEYNTLMNKKQEEANKMSVQSQQEYKDLNTKYNKVQQKNQQLEQQLEKEKQFNYQQQQEIASLKSGLDELQDENDRLNMQIEEMQTEINNYVKNNEQKKDKKHTNANKIMLDDEDDRVDVPDTYCPQRASSTAQRPDSRTNKQPSRSLSSQKIQGAFNEAKRTINDLQDQLKLVKDENDKIKKQMFLDQAKHKDDEENYIKQLEQKEAEIRDLQTMLDTQENNQASYLTSPQKEIEPEEVQNQPRFNSSEYNKPLPVYHSLVNPSAPHNARKEFSQLINENNLLKQENKILRQKTQKYDEIDLENKKLQNQITDLTNKNINTTNNAFLKQQQKKYEEIQNNPQFNAEQFKKDLGRARTITLRSRPSFFERKDTILTDHSEPGNEQETNKPSANQVLAKEVQLPTQLITNNISDMHLDSEVSLLDQKNPTFESYQESYKKACAYIKQCERELADKDITDAENKVLHDNILKLEEDNKNLHKIIDGSNAQIVALQQQIDQYKIQPNEIPINNVQIIQPQPTKAVTQKPQVVERGLQAGLAQSIPIKHFGTQTQQIFDSVSRAQPTLTNEDGFQYQMGDDQLFVVLNSKTNSVDRYYKLSNNMVTDEWNRRVDFNGTYKDNRGLFNVLHGVIDLSSCRSVDAFSSRQNYGDVYQQLQQSRVELQRLGAENQELIVQLSDLRERLTQAKAPHLERLLDDDAPPRLLSPPEQLPSAAAVPQETLIQPESRQNLQNITPIPQYKIPHHTSQAATSPTVPEEHWQAYGDKNSKDIQTELYVVPAEVYQREKDRSDAISRKNCELQLRLRDFDKLKHDFEKRQNEYRALVEHTKSLNDQISTAERQNMYLKQHNTELQAQAELLAAASTQHNNLFAETGQAQAELFDNMRISLRQKDAQIADLQQLLQQQRLANVEQIKQLTEELEKMKQLGDHYNMLEVNALKQDLINQQNAIANKIIEGRYGQKLRAMGISDEPLQVQLLEAQRENRRLRKAGELIKEAFVGEQNKSFAVQKANSSLKNALILLFTEKRWTDLELLLHGDDSADGIEKAVKQRLCLNNDKNSKLQSRNMENQPTLQRQNVARNASAGYADPELLTE